MTWNHRVMRKNDTDGSFIYSIHEVIYDDQGDGQSWTEERITPVEGSLKDLKNTLRRMLEACDKPVMEACGEVAKEMKDEQVAT